MEQSRGVETGGGGGSRLSEMPPPLSTRVCGEFSGQGESFEEEERGGGGGLERECGRAWLWDLLGGQIIKLKGTAPEKPCYWAWAHGHLFFSPYYYY